MRIALCLFGVIGGVEGKAGYSEKSSDEILRIGYQHYKKYFLDKYDIDVFIHTWSVDYKYDILKYYKPNKYLFQNQKKFEISSKINIDLQYKERDPNRAQNHYSRWYSTKKVIELKKQYEKENNFIYDFVFITRFDVAFSTKINFYKLDKNKFYTSHWCYCTNIFGNNIPINIFYSMKEYSLFPLYFHKHKSFPHEGGLSDLWFVTNSKFADNFSLLYDNLDKYLKDVELSNHKLAEYHIRKLGIINELAFLLHRYKDFALVRNKYFRSKLKIAHHNLNHIFGVINNQQNIYKTLPNSAFVYIDRDPRIIFTSQRKYNVVDFAIRYKKNQQKINIYKKNAEYSQMIKFVKYEDLLKEKKYEEDLISLLDSNVGLNMPKKYNKANKDELHFINIVLKKEIMRNNYQKQMVKFMKIPNKIIIINNLLKFSIKYYPKAIIRYVFIKTTSGVI